MGNAFDPSDRLECFTLELEGDYSAGVVCEEATLKNLLSIRFGAGFDYNLTLNAGAAIVNEPLLINNSREADGDLIIDASALGNGVAGDTFYDTVSIHGTVGHNEFTGGRDNDTFTFLEGTFSSTDIVDGNDGDDFLGVTGDYAAGLTLQVTNVELVSLDGGKYLVSVADAAVAAGARMTVAGSSTEKITFGGAAERDGFLTLIGGSGNDSFIGGRMSDILEGGGGGDTLTGGTGNASDTFKYFSASDSNGPNYDTVNGFDFAAEDVFDMPGTGTVTGIDATVASGTLSTATFDADLAAAAGAGPLGGHHALLFTPNAGTLAGKTFLVVDLNGTAGYQGGPSGDIVVRLSGAQSLGSLNVNDFI
jgi:Ca2+-binding RTX toxin-like protein